MKRLRQEGMPHQEALLKCSRAFQDYIGEICMAAILARDKRAVQLVLERGGEAVHALRVLGALDPPWRVWRRGDSAERLAHEFGDNLDQTRPNREYSMRSRIVRVETAAGYSKSRLRPRDLASPAVNHVISASDVARLRSGECLVLDPNPALLSASGFAAAMADLMGVVNRKGVAESHNPCNKGSFHGMLPVNPSSGAAEGLGPSTCELLRKLAALPALIERHGWPRPLALPSMVQLGFYPGGSGAAYRPHLDRWASEVNNRRELTFLVYCNVGWDAEKHGGCLRLHPDPNHPGENTVDVEPIAGRVVVFESGKQMHEVREAFMGADRLALTLWVEYGEDWQKPAEGMMPALKL